MLQDIKTLIKEMTLEEKAGLCSGKDFWNLKGIERLNIPSVMVCDGPHGLRKQEQQGDHLGVNDSIKAVCFPSACATAASFDRDLLKTLGETLGEECQAENVSVLLGPAVNIKRSPLCGRNFEYFSEDPYLAGELAKSYIEGVQSKNVGTSIKHFAANNQEYRRMTCSSEIDEQTLREIYLAAFETAVKEAKPWTVMCSYNRVNGVLASENPVLLNDILRDEWGFDGFVVSDWGAVSNRVEGLKAGLELEMPSSNGITDKEIVNAVKNGTLSMDILNCAVERILNIVARFVNNRITAEFDKEKHHRLAVSMEEECAVLLKNENRLLPLNSETRVAFIGQFAENPRFQGGGSSHINACKVSDALSSTNGMLNMTYAKGYDLFDAESNQLLISEALRSAESSDVVVIFAGLPDSYECEGYDREHMRLPDYQNKLIEEVAAINPNTVVVLHNGSPVEMPWVNKVPCILELYLGGQGVGEATINLLTGKANPCGRLAESFPVKLSDNPSYLNFPGDGKKVNYQEGIFVGYRYYDKKEMNVLFPFGHGLSYTSFSYSNLRVCKENMSESLIIKVQVDVTNTGDYEGKEVVQLYVSDRSGTPNRPLKELKGFSKVCLEPGQTKTVEMTLTQRAFSWYNTEIKDWYHADGDYEILIAKSANDIVLNGTVHLEATHTLPFVVGLNTTIEELLQDPRTSQATQELIKNYASQEQSLQAAEAITPEMMASMMKYAPLRSLRNFIGLDDNYLLELIQYMNSLL